MKNLSFLLFILLTMNAFGQETTPTQKKTYSSFSTEMIFSFADIDNQGNSEGNNLRWAPVFSPQWMLNRDLGSSFGLYTGMAVHNVGFIYNHPMDSAVGIFNSNTKYKYRTYNFGIPVGFKIGSTDKVLFFAGYEVEFPFVYKEKKFVNENKEDKNVVWFSDKVEQVQQSVMAGFQFKYGATLKFKYYLSNFHNRDYTTTVDGVVGNVKPYDFKANVFYISLGWDLFTDYHKYSEKF